MVQKRFTRLIRGVYNIFMTLKFLLWWAVKHLLSKHAKVTILSRNYLDGESENNFEPINFKSSSILIFRSISSQLRLISGKKIEMSIFCKKNVINSLLQRVYLRNRLADNKRTHTVGMVWNVAIIWHIPSPTEESFHIKKKESKAKPKPVSSLWLWEDGGKSRLKMAMINLLRNTF